MWSLAGRGPSWACCHCNGRIRAVVLPYPSPVASPAPRGDARMTKGASLTARAPVFQRPVFSSVQMRVYWRSTSGGSTAKVNSFASTSAGG